MILSIIVKLLGNRVSGWVIVKRLNGENKKVLSQKL